MGEGVRLTKLLPLLVLLLLLLAPEGGQGRKMRGARGREESYGARGGIQGGLAELLGGLLPNTYYSRPNYRYPYYDNTGKVISLSAVISQLGSLFSRIFIQNRTVFDSILDNGMARQNFYLVSEESAKIRRAAPLHKFLASLEMKMKIRTALQKKPK